MSGICGFVNFDERPASDDKLNRMLHQIRHRGTGKHLSYVSGSAGFGMQLHNDEFSREEYAQMRSISQLDNGLRVLSDGEIYNRGDIGELLDVPQERALSTFEMIGLAYLRWGISCFSKFAGPFSIAIFDPRDKFFVLARDVYGIKPVFYYSRGGLLVFASEIKGILAHSEVSKRLDKKALCEFLSCLYIPHPRTIYQNLCALPPGSALILKAGQLSVETFEEFICPALSDVAERNGHLETDEALDGFESVFRQLVADRMSKSGRTGVFLSGGVDSSLIAAFAADIDRDRTEAFTIGFMGAQWDEEASVASEIARLLGIKHTSFKFTSAECVAGLRKMPKCFDQPFGDWAAIPTLLACERIPSDVVSIMDGTGAGGMFALTPSKIKQLSFDYTRHVPRVMRATLAAFFRFAPIRKVRRYRGLFNFDAIEDLFLQSGHWNQDDLESLLGFNCDLSETGPFKLFSTFQRGQAREARTEISCRYIVPSKFLRRVVDPASHTTHIARIPFMDRRLAKRLREIPAKHLFDENQEKLLITSLLTRYLPAEFAGRAPAAFVYPQSMLLDHNQGELIKQHLDRKKIEAEGLFRYQTVLEAVSEYKRSNGVSRTAQRKVGALVLFELWLENSQL
ncbi:hypothetical protein J7M28_05625 [bacterium]|nr:hypothetical protein [bacterium]